MAKEKKTKEYYVYVIELDPEFGVTSKAKKANPDRDPSKPCIYVGSSSNPPEQRFAEHFEGKRSARGFPLFSRKVHKWGLRLLPHLYQQYNPMATQEEAQAMERHLAEKYRRFGYTVWWG